MNKEKSYLTIIITSESHEVTLNSKQINSYSVVCAFRYKNDIINQNDHVHIKMYLNF